MSETEHDTRNTFAVYSKADKSLRFYNRQRRPIPRRSIDGKTLVKVYESRSFRDAPWKEHAHELETVEVIDQVTAPKNMNGWFKGLERLTRCDLANLDTSATLDMGNMFKDCKSLQVLDLSGLDTRNVTNFKRMFADCSSLESINLSSFDTSAATNMRAMFVECRALESLDVSGFETSQTTAMYAMFKGCSSLKDLDLSGFDLSKTDLTEADDLIGDCDALPPETAGLIERCLRLNGRPWRRSRTPITPMSETEHDIRNAFAVYNDADKSLLFYNRETVPKTGETFEGRIADEVYTDILKQRGGYGRVVWSDHAADIATVEVVDEGISPESTASWFKGFEHMTTCDLARLEMSNATDMNSMFMECSSLKQVDLSGLDTFFVENMSWMFAYCDSLEELDLSNLDTYNVESTAYMFFNSGSLRSVDLSGFDGGSVSAMGSMFSGCASLEHLDLSAFSNPNHNIDNMESMFSGCSSLEELEMPNLDISSVVGTSSMFAGCTSLKRLDLGSSGTYSARYMSRMFRDCHSLQTFDPSCLKFSNIRDGEGVKSMFAGCGSMSPDLAAAINRHCEDFAPVNTAFAAYSKAEKSLRFYCRAILPFPGSAIDGKTVDAVYGENLFEGHPWDELARNIEVVEAVDKVPVSSMNNWFKGFSRMTRCDLANLDTSSTSDMGSMFEGCERLETLDLSGLDTRKVANFKQMFKGCGSLQSLDLSGFDTAAAVNMRDMFKECSSLVDLDLSGFDFSKAGLAKADDLIAGCESLSPENASRIGQSIEGAKSVFAVYSSDGKSLRFYRRARVPKVGQLTKGGARVDQVYMADSFDRAPWRKHARGIETVEIVDDGIAPKSMAGWFFGFEHMTDCDIAKLDTSRVESMRETFHGCGSLTRLDLSSFETSRVEDMGFMFAGCEGLKRIYLTSFDASKVRTMDAMFQGCKALKSLNLSHIRASAVSDLSSMFAGCESLEKVNLSGIKISGTESIDAIFDGCDLLPAETIDALEAKVADAAAALATEKAASLPLYRAADGERALDLSIAALERRAQGFPAEERGWTMRAADGHTVDSRSLDGLLGGVEVFSINEGADGMKATLLEDGMQYEAEIRLSPFASAEWDECEPPCVGAWVEASDEPLQWSLGACPTVAELTSPGCSGRIAAEAAAEAGGAWSATVSAAERTVVRMDGLSQADDARRVCEMGAFRLGGTVSEDSAARFAEVSAKVEAAAAGTLSDLAAAPGIDGEALLADWARESRGADPEKTAAFDAVEALGPLSAYVCGNVRPAVQAAGRTVEAVRDGAAQAGILRAEAMEAARAASVDAAVSMMAKGAEGAAVVYRDLAFAPAADGTWTVMKESAEGAFSPFEAGWRPGALSFDEKAAAAEIAKMEAATPAECAAGGWRDAGARAAEVPAKSAPSKRAQAPARVDPALFATAHALGSSSLGAR